MSIQGRASQKTTNHQQRATLLLFLLSLSFLLCPASSNNPQIYCVCFVWSSSFTLTTLRYRRQTAEFQLHRGCCVVSSSKSLQWCYRAKWLSKSFVSVKAKISGVGVSQKAKVKQMPNLEQIKKASGSSSNTSETHKILAQVQQKPHAQESNAKFSNDATAVSKQQDSRLKTQGRRFRRSRRRLWKRSSVFAWKWNIWRDSIMETSSKQK